MDTTILSLLLSALMFFSPVSYSVPVEGNDAWYNDPQYHWVAIPTSADGLADGAYYLDFDGYLEEAVSRLGNQLIRDGDFFYTVDGELISPLRYADFPNYNAFGNGNVVSTEEKIAEMREYLAILKTGEWYFDENNFALYGTFTDPEKGQATFSDSGSFWLLRYVLNQAGAGWKDVKLSDNDLEDGDYYASADAVKTALLNGYFSRFSAESFSEQEKAEFAAQITVTSVSKHTGNSDLLKYRIGLKYMDTVTQTNHGDMFFPPCGKVETPYDIIFDGITAELDSVVMQYKANDGGQETGTPSNSTMSFLQRIIAFFQRIIDFFQGIFNN